VLAIDQFSKNLAIENLAFATPVPAIPGLLNFTLLYNDSAAFSLGGGATWIFSIISSIAALVILWLSRKIETTSWAIMAGILLGGVVGNLVDRLSRYPGFGVGKVVDFLQLPFGFPVFNIADSAIVIIAIVTVIRVLRGDAIGRKSA
jgi:signal peptidase II